MPSTRRKPNAPLCGGEHAASLLINAIRKLAGARELVTISEIVRSTARQLVGADGATFVLRRGAHCYYLDEDAISPLWKGQLFPLEACISGWAMLHQEQVAISDIYADSRIPHDAYRPTFVKSLVMTPVRREPAFAAIGTYWAHHRQPSAEELGCLQDLADATAVAIENAEVYAQLESKVAARTQELVALYRELEAFSYTVAHDLRSPLTALIGFAELADRLLGKARDEEVRDTLRDIAAAGDQMSKLISDLLDFARCSHSDLRSAEVDLSALAEGIARDLAQQEPRRQVVFELEPGLTVYGDNTLMKVVVNNLLSNAFKYTRDRDPAKISFGRLGGSDVPTFFVKDNGTGFDAGLVSRLFQPFQRLHSEREFEGTGVGLATVERIIRRHRGKVWAESKVNEGATFYFSVPRPASLVP